MVTGATGLLGRALMRSDLSEATGTKLIGATRRGEMGNGYVQGDYDPRQVGSILAQFSSLKEVIHCAGVSGVFSSMRDPVLDHANNVDPFMFSLELARAAGAKLTLVSSMEVYGSTDLPQRSEAAPLRPENFLGLSKLYCEQMMRLYHKVFGVEYVILRPSIFFGPGFTKGLLHDLVTGFAKRSRQVDIFCTTDSQLNFVHVDEVVSAMKHLHLAGLRNDVWNVGLTETPRVSELIEWFSCRYGYRPEIRIREENRQVKTAPIDKLQATGWRPAKGLYEHIEMLIASSENRDETEYSSV